MFLYKLIALNKLKATHDNSQNFKKIAMNYSCLDTPQVGLCALAEKDYQPLIQTRPLLQCEVCVIVPVRNEAELLEECLNALAYQIDFQGQPLDFKRYEVILLVNNCSDNSAAIAYHFSRQHPELRLHIIERMLPPAEAYIGRVRQMLMDEAYHRLAWLGLAGLGTRHGVIASTDGDTKVSPTWIAATLLELARGVDAVGAELLPIQRAVQL